MSTRIRPTGPSAPVAIGAIYGLMLRTQATRGRLLALGALGLVGVAIGAAVGLAADVDQLDAGTGLSNTFGLSLFAPVATLVFASAALGDPAEDATLVYLWLRPVPRWHIVAAAWLASLSVALPLVCIPLVAAAVLSGGGSGLVVGTALSSALAVVAYSAIFLALGLRVRRALVWGLAYILIWEGFVASAGDNAARLAIRAYTRSVLARAADVELRLAELSPVVAVVFPLVAAAVALAYTTRRLKRQDVA